MQTTSLKLLVGLPMGNLALQMANARVPSSTSGEDDFHWSVNIYSTRWVNATWLSWAPLSSWCTIHPVLYIILNLCICPLQMTNLSTGSKFYLPITGSCSSASVYSLPSFLSTFKIHCNHPFDLRNLHFTAFLYFTIYFPLFHLWVWPHPEVFTQGSKRLPCLTSFFFLMMFTKKYSIFQWKSSPITIPPCLFTKSIFSLLAS